MKHIYYESVHADFQSEASRIALPGKQTSLSPQVLQVLLTHLWAHVLAAAHLIRRAKLPSRPTTVVILDLVNSA